MFNKITRSSVGVLGAGIMGCWLALELCKQPAIIERFADLLGPNLILWRTHLFRKASGALPIPWHQHAANWPLVPGNTVSAWIALDDATRSNGCLEMLPGQNKKLVRQQRVKGFDRFNYEADTQSLDTSKSRFMEMSAGQFIIFDDHLPHRSGANSSNQSRLALAMRVTRPEVQINTERLFTGFHVLLLHGEHRNGINPLGSPPGNPGA